MVVCGGVAEVDEASKGWLCQSVRVGCNMANMGYGRGGFCVNFDLIFFSFFFCGSSFGFGFCHWFDLILGWIFFVGSWCWSWGLPWW